MWGNYRMEEINLSILLLYILIICIYNIYTCILQCASKTSILYAAVFSKVQ